METVGLCERETVMNVLTQGMELANELKRKIHPTPLSKDSCGVLVENILSTYENALTLLALVGNTDSSQLCVDNLLELPNSIEGSPTSEGSEQSCKNFKKRKTLPRWSEQVRVCSGIGSEGQIDDGYSWRKYGQKDIMGANHPRAYYRCTHRNTQGCLATKQVQRTDGDSSTFEIVYKGKHSCRQESPREKKEKRQSQQMMVISNEPSSLCLKTEIQELDPKIEHFPSFSFPTTPIEPENVESPFFSEPSNFIGTPPFLSPATSESFFSLNDLGIDLGFQSSDSDFAEIVSNPTPFVRSFTFGDLDFLENLDEFK